MVQQTPPYTDRTIQDTARLKCEVELARQRGYAEQFGEYSPQWGSYAVAIPDDTGRPRVAIGVPFAIEEHGSGEFGARFKEQIVNRLLACAREISGQLGVRPTVAIA
jgi:DNA-binding IclR family transcriptional regulator